MEPRQNGHDPPLGAYEAPLHDPPLGAYEAPLQDPPLGAYEAPLHHQQSQNTVGPALEGGNTAPSTTDPPLEVDNTVPSSFDPPIQQCDAVSSTASMIFPECGHFIAGDIYDDFLTKRDSDCPICQQGPFQAVMKFAFCEHLIVGDPLNRVFKSRTDQCPVCLPSSNEDVVTDAYSDPTRPTPAIVHTERSRVTLNKYQDPFTFGGLTGEIYAGKDGKARLGVEEKVWKSWSRKRRAHFVYCTNIRVGAAVGESRPAPTNPANPNHPEHRLLSTASILRRNLKQKPDPDRVAAAIRELLATPDKDVAARKSHLRPFNSGDA